MQITNDGHRYFAMSYQRVARPFHWRWLLPKLCGRDIRRWKTARAIALGGMLPAAWWFADGGWRGVFVAVMVVGLTGVWAFNWRWPVLVDAPAMFFALVSAASVNHGLWWLGIFFALLAGSTKETSPIFAAAWAWSPICLVGLVAPAVRTLQHAGSDVLNEENRWILEHPFLAARKYHRGINPDAWVLPWGACLVGLAHLSWPLAATLALAYAQCFIATDLIRLYQWAWPVLALAAANAVPLRWLPFLAVLHLVNPYAGDGN
jgi:hypothetical protein